MSRRRLEVPSIPRISRQAPWGIHPHDWIASCERDDRRIEDRQLAEMRNRIARETAQPKQAA